ncbi:16S rRNA (cytosine(967)-C(5))-methyltransferase RsmB [Rhodoferax aquaticus]|uniref:16S rRNA (cytosine(967)-C(5))-methyltransferase n=1 Tax=Rhodoferax aquaticus TaxID=2527691 RepID=A0A515EUA6_9BURK|nr:16S rRNA (cytosine(967)-C(5))-methyltransferase RsmB [Rhodoferax aquaticus]QDL56239.1 16S rRNA (cytosine(967)-C(5))-methyltransferase RsmB [Rhodoferax aquaticus]
MLTPSPRTPLWTQLQLAAQVVQAVRTGASGTAAIDGIPADLRPGVQALAFHVWRHLGRAELLLSQLVTKRPTPAAHALLCTALALVASPTQTLYDPHTLVNQAVEAAKRSQQLRQQANFINACLRRYLREKTTLDAVVQDTPVAQHNHPQWWIDRLRQEYPDAWQGILSANNAAGPMTLRVNHRQTTRDRYLDDLIAAGHDAIAVGPVAIRLQSAVPVNKLPGFWDGMVSVQDAAAQLAAPLLLNGLQHSKTTRILDACAAPGGKTGHLLELTDAEVSALDIDPKRCERIRQNTGRLKLRAEVLSADASQPERWWDGRQFDAILLDAPCTASGIVRRHPDVRWLRRETDIAQLAAEQKALLSTLWPLVKVGGRLLYCTCSVFKAEGSEQIATFLSRNTDASLLPSPGHLLPQSYNAGHPVPDNQPNDHDGFYYALLQKQLG